MVGSLHGGTMVDHDHEAVPGDVLTQILARVPRSTGFKVSDLKCRRYSSSMLYVDEKERD